MARLPSRLRRLDDALADLPVDDPMLLTELDGFLTGVIVSPELIRPSEWLPIVWSGEETDGAPFDDPADVQWFAEAVMARYNEIVRDLGRGKLQPIFDVDERNGDVLWELWIDGFAQAMARRPAAWTAHTSVSVEAAAALAQLSTLVAVARNESDLDSIQINALNDEAPAAISAQVVRLYGLRRPVSISPLVVPPRATKIGRNEPCPCGSAKKYKRCCGSAS
ncbi:UPF0149 family protein [Sphingomonas sp.]|uniref:UPF0149 family protein n=1 Tax=Sphingomonas sp. TaxID=28214 RepID=UPI0025D25314|nr:UPF0149 family protein [Sphingomonas sp.]MBV9527331.1 UPF0149 family protein [Sphingomonas sp.]